MRAPHELPLGGGVPTFGMRVWQLVAWIVLYVSALPLLCGLFYLVYMISLAMDGELEGILLGLFADLLLVLFPLLASVVAIPIGFPSARRRMRRVRKPAAWIVLVLVGLSVTGSLLWILVPGIASEGDYLPRLQNLSIVMCWSAPTLLYEAMAAGLAVRAIRDETKVRRSAGRPSTARRSI